VNGAASAVADNHESTGAGPKTRRQHCSKSIAFVAFVAAIDKVQILLEGFEGERAEARSGVPIRIKKGPLTREPEGA